jgi:aminodeoxyfutalosine synthase
MDSEVSAPLEEVAARLERGEELSRDDAERLLETKDLIAVGVLADEVRRRLRGARVTFLRVLDVPPDGPIPPIAADTGELRVTGVEPDSGQMLARIRQVAARAGDVPVSAGALHEVSGAFARRMKESGATCVAEAALDRILDRSAIEDVRAAGLDVARWGVQSYLPLGPLDLLEHVRSLGPLRSFAPLPRVVDPAAPTTGYDDVKLVAVSRLFLPRVDSISVDWSIYGPKLAQVALTFGADDFDGVPADVGSPNLLGPRRAILEDVRRNIRAASLTPVARNARFEVLE